jgi:hypothetical protein
VVHLPDGMASDVDPVPQRDAGREAGHHLAAAAFVSAVVAAVYGTIAWGLFVRFEDFADHLDVAYRLYETGRPPVPHFLFHALTAVLFGSTLASSYETAGRLVMVGSYGLTGLVTYGLYWRLFRESPVGRPWTIAVAALATVTAAPVTAAHAYALGYLWPEPYHSQTFALLKPFALAGFGGVAWCLSRRDADPRFVALFALVTIAGALSKPSFVICALPAATILIGVRMRAGQPVSMAGLVGGLYFPAAVVLTWQFLAAYSGLGAADMYQDSVAWAPLKFMNYWTTGLPLKFAASVAFPLLVAVLYWPLTLRDTMLQLAWLCFLFGAFYSYTLAETVNWTAGNFVWSGYITLFTLYAATMVFWLRQLANPLRGRQPGRMLICGAAIGMHVLSGARMDWLYLTHYGCRVDFRLVEFVCD